MAAPPAPKGESAATTCILWTAATEAPAPLTQLLAQRGFDLQPAADRYSAMAAACCAARAGRRTVLILDQPGRLKGSRELIEALQGRLPDTAIWTYDPQRKPALGGLEALSGPTSASSRSANGAVPRASQIPLRLVGDPRQDRSGPAEPPVDSDDPSAAGGTAGARSSILSPEELEMLLADDPAQATEDRRGKK